MTTITLNPGQVVGFTGNLVLPDGYTTSPGSFTWSTNNSAVATVTTNTRWVNNHPTARITAVALGSATITCTSGALSTQIIVNVTPELQPSSLVITVGVPSQGWGGPSGYGDDPPQSNGP